MTPDRKTLNVLLAALALEQRELAERMGYDPGYLVNVTNGFTTASPSFRRAFGETIAALIFGPWHPTMRQSYPPEPLVELVKRRAAEMPSKRDFYRDLGTSPQALKGRKSLDGLLVDRICCALGVHPSSVYGRDFEIGEAS
jgi:PAS domain-containing protein